MQDQNILDTGSGRPLSEETKAQLYQLQFDLQLADGAIRNGMIVLYVVGGFMTLFGLLRLVETPPEEIDPATFQIVGIASAALGFFFVLLGVLARRYPVPVFSIAAGVYILMLVGDLISNFGGAMLVSIVRVAIILVWVRSIRAAVARRATAQQAAASDMSLDDLRAVE
jgi:hypothetical protein